MKHFVNEFLQQLDLSDAYSYRVLPCQPCIFVFCFFILRTKIVRIPLTLFADYIFAQRSLSVVDLQFVEVAERAYDVPFANGSCDGVRVLMCYNFTGDCSAEYAKISVR